MRDRDVCAVEISHGHQTIQLRTEVAAAHAADYLAAFVDVSAPSQTDARSLGNRPMRVRLTPAR